jgi:hypothetical protein
MLDNDNDVVCGEISSSLSEERILSVVCFRRLYLFAGLFVPNSNDSQFLSFTRLPKDHLSNHHHTPCLTPRLQNG